MSDQLNGLFADVRGVLPPAEFAPPEQVRRRGRQRTRRTAIGAGAGVLAVTTAAVGLGAGLPSPPDSVAPPGGPTPTATAPSPTVTAPAPTASPTPSASARTPAARLLQPDDLGPGSWQRFEAEQIDNPDQWFWGFWDGLCPAYETGAFPSLRYQDRIDTAAYRTGPDNSAFQILENYPGWAEQNLDDVRAVIDQCGEPSVNTPDLRVSVVGSGVAGDESLLVRQEQTPADGSEPVITYIAVVRIGDNVTTVRAYPSDPDRVRDLAKRAAARLR
ncbi:hypothetical protein [Micromonospora sp. NPDC126480]|uniref:hypothetical protein n=1 Tax=Micromonospora sp. NPDC126480 TaxID=3155312 RepID=UPI00331AA83B